jgi:PKD repeat protein
MKKLLWALTVIGSIWLVSGLSLGAAPLQADFTYEPLRPDINTEVTFDAGLSESPAVPIVRYEWDLDGDGRYEAVSEEPILVSLFDEGGVYPVTLRVTDEVGGQAITTKSLEVRSAPVRVRRAIATPLEPNRVAAGSSFQVTVRIDVLQTVNGLGLDEDLPEGWRVSGVEHAGAAFKSTDAQWLWFQTLTPGSELEVIYNVTVPRGTPPSTFEIEGTISSFSPRFEIVIPGDRAVRVF